jgi:hypothetical protein
VAHFSNRGLAALTVQSAVMTARAVVMSGGKSLKDFIRRSAPLVSARLEPENPLRTWSALALYCRDWGPAPTQHLYDLVLGSEPRPSAKASSWTRRTTISFDAARLGANFVLLIAVRVNSGLAVHDRVHTVGSSTVDLDCERVRPHQHPALDQLHVFA